MPDQNDQSEGRKDNAAQPVDREASQVSPQAYPPAGKDDSIERTGRTEEVTGEPRSFESPTGNPAPPQGAGDSSPVSTKDGYAGPKGDPAEGKR